MIRSARTEDLAQLTELALRSKAVWGYTRAFIVVGRTVTEDEP